MGRSINGSDLVFLEDGTILEKKSYGTYIIGHSSDVSTWETIRKNYCYGEPTLKDVVSRVWDKIPTPPMFEVVYGKRHSDPGLDGIKELRVPSGKEGVQVGFDTVTFTTSNPFVIPDEDMEKVMAAIVEYKHQRDAEWELRKATQTLVGDEILTAVRAYLEGSHTFELKEVVCKDKVSTNLSKVVVLANGIEVVSLKLMDFVKQVFPELWEKWDNI